MPQKQFYLTSEGLADLKAKLQHLRTVKRSEVAGHILRAKEPGGPADNAEYDDAKNQQAFVEGRILTLENMVHNAVIIPDEKPISGVVELGSTVTVMETPNELVQYTIVGSTETDPKGGRISNESPVGMALLRKKAGDSVEVKVPAGMLTLTVVEVK